MRHVVAASLMLLFSASGIASPGLLAVNPKTINGVWEAADFGSGRFYRLEVRFPAATLIVACPKMEHADFVFESVRMSVTGGKMDILARDVSTGMEMRIRGAGRANETLGELRLSLHVRDDEHAPLLKEWNEPSREFWKQGSMSRMDDLIKAEKRAAELSKSNLKRSP